MTGTGISAAERLRKLQMEDLGTARREYISTNDRKRFLNAGLDELDAARVANKAGSEAHRAAEANKARLASWANVHKKLDDTQDLEHLDSLLDGQSHRAQLNALIRESGGQAYTKVMNKKDNFLKVAETDHHKGLPPGRRPSGGRGGGVIGKRGRQTTPTSHGGGSSRTSHQGFVRKLGRHIVEVPSGGSRLDPPLDCNKIPSKGRDDKFNPRGKAGDKQSARTNLRTRRPIVGDYARILSPPECFLAIARSNFAPAKPSNDASQAAPQSPNIPSSLQAKAEQPQTEPQKIGKKTPVSHEKVVKSNMTVASPRPQRGVEPIPTPKTSSYDLKIPKSNVSAAPTSPAKPLAGSEKDEESKLIILKHPNSPAERVERDAVADLRATGNVSKVRQPAPSDELSSRPKAEGKEPQNDILLDFGTTPPEPSSMHEKHLKSPAFEDLRGIDFEHPPDTTSLRVTTNERSTSEKISKELRKSEFYKGTVSSSNGTIDRDYEREIFLLSVFLESTTLGDEFCGPLKKIKAEIEEMFRESQKTPASGTQQNIDSESSITAAQPKTTPEIRTPLEDTPTKHAKKPSVSPLDEIASAQRLRQAVNAAPFYPRSSSFSGYRSPINSISSDSTSPPSTPVPSQPTQSKAIPIRKLSPVPAEPENPTEHIFGDHLLPGRRPRVASSLQSPSPASRTSTNVSFSIPARGSALKDVNIPDFERAHYTEPATQIKASKDIVVPTKTDFSHMDVPSPLFSNKEPAPSIPQVASSTEKVEAKRDSLQRSTHVAKSPIQANTSNDASMEQNNGPVIRPSPTPRPGANPVSLKSPPTIIPKTLVMAPKLGLSQLTTHAVEPAPRTNFSEKSSMLRSDATRANSTHVETSVPAKNSPINMIKELPGPKPKLASIKQSIHAVAGATPPKHQPSMSIPKRVDLNVDQSKHSIYAAPPETQQRESSAHLSDILSFRYAMSEDHGPSR